MHNQAHKAPYTLKKSLGQHFLRNDAYCHQIVDVLKQQAFTQLAEIGPGGGALTQWLLKIPGVALKVIEIDKEKVEYLAKRFPALEGCIVHQSILDAPLPFEGNFTLVGNFPYNISTEIVFKVLEWHPQVEAMVGMFQKEVAQRLAAGPGSKVYGVTSVLVQAIFEVEYLFDVPPEAFEPPPKVMSGVVRFLPRAAHNPPPAITSMKDFRLVVKTAFNQRRKQLRNGLKPLFEPDVLQDELFSRRAEQLSVAEFAALTFKLKKNTV